MDELPANSVATVFGTSLRQIREQRGWSQSELARQMKSRGWDTYSQVAVSRTEEGTRVVRLDEAFALADALLCSVSDLLTPDRTAQELRENRETLRTHAYVILDGIEQYFFQRSMLQDAYDRAMARVNEDKNIPPAIMKEIKAELVLASLDLAKNYSDYAENVEDDDGDD